MSSFFLHVDLDAFFASVEQLDFPDYKGKAVIVGGLPSDKRAVVSTCSYEARKYGVHSAMPISTAYKLCPNGIYLRGRMERYHEKSKEVMRIFYDFSPDVKQMSIDEAFIDISGTQMLFGPPDILGKMLKKQVFEKTGLTVSVGIASNKYIAKIASGINKPDGLCYVEKGQEEEFMLKLPLSKLWGAGTKTQDKLKSFGFYTTKDIYNAPLSSLTTLFGSCTGAFLYNAVRGKEVETFSDEVKSHSISSEETFSYDLQDIFTIETALLKLCYEVRFRLLDEGWHTKTLHVKIRYEDFSTVSVQSTFQRGITSLEDMYEKVCNLFRNKYEFGKGIRLLGVGAFNLAKGSTSKEIELFDFGEDKKQKIETAVLNYQKKNPKSQIKKARQFIKKGLLTILLCFSISFSSKSFAENPVKNQTEKETEFYAEGNWETSLKQTITFNFQENDVNVEVLPLVFNQKAALSCFFMYDKKWYVDAVFQDGFENNQLVIGYKNQFNNGIFTDIKVGNKDIALTSDYGTNFIGKGISGGEEVNFGVKGLFERNISENKKLKSEVFLRFDNFANFSKTWNGDYLFNSTEVELTDYIEKKYFNLPFSFSNFLGEEIYSKNHDGKFEKRNDFLIYPVKYQIEFSEPLSSQTLISISNIDIIKQELLEYIKTLKLWFSDIPLTEYLDFLGIQDTNISSIEELTENHLDVFFTKLNQRDFLILFNPGYFSLFENKNYFSLSTSSIDNVEIISKTAKKPISKTKIAYSLNQEGNLVLSYDFQDNLGTENDNSIFIKNMFPLGNISPLIYFLPKESSSSFTDFAIAVQSETQVDNYNIGTFAYPSSVVSYVNGILTPCSYDKNTGNVEITPSPMPEDTVQIFWKEYSKSGSIPTLFSAFGLEYDINNNLSLSSAISYSSPILFDFFNSSKNYSISSNFETESQFQSSFLSSVTLDYQKENKNSSFSINNTTSGEFINYNITNNYMIYSANNNLASKKNYFNNNSIISGNGTVQQVKNTKYEIVANIKENAEYEEITFLLPNNSFYLYEAEGFFLEAKISNLSILDDYNIYLEIGDIENIPAKWTFNNDLSTKLETSFVPLYFPISNLDKTRLGDCKTGKIIFEKKNSNQNSNFGNLTIRSIEFAKTGFLSDYGIQITNDVYKGVIADKILLDNLNPTDIKNVRKYISPFSIENYENFIISLYIPDSTNYGNFIISLYDYNEKLIFTKTYDFSSLQKNQWIEINIATKDFLTVANAPSTLEFSFFNTENNPIDIELYLQNITLKNAKTDFIISDVLNFSYLYNDSFFLNSNISSFYNLGKTNPNFSGHFVNNIGFDFEYFYFNNQFISNFNCGNINYFNFSQSSHSLGSNKKLFNIINFKENYNYAPEEMQIGKSNNINLDFSEFKYFPVSVEFISEIKEKTENNNDKNLVSKTEKISTILNLQNYRFGLDLDFSKKIENNKSLILDTNYFNTYGNATYFQIIKKPDNSFQRRESFLLKQKLNINLFSISPTLDFYGENLFFKNGDNQILSNLGYSLSIPLYVKGHKFSLNYEEKVSNFVQQGFLSSSALPCTYEDDINLFFQNSSLFKLIIPFYASDDKIFEITQNSNFENGNTKSYITNFSWSRNIFANYLDIFIPTSFNLSYNKTLKASKINLITNHNLLAKFSFTAFNLFGNNSDLRFFNWYNQDELINSFSIGYNNNKINFSFLSNINLYLDNNSIIQQAFEFKNTFGTELSIFESFSWSRLGKNAYLVPLIQLFNENYIPKKIVRWNRFSFSYVNKTNSSQTQTYDLEHKVSLFILENASIDTLISGIYTKIQETLQKTIIEKNKLEFSLSISAKLSF